MASLHQTNLLRVFNGALGLVFLICASSCSTRFHPSDITFRQTSNQHFTGLDGKAREQTNCSGGAADWQFDQFRLQKKCAHPVNLQAQFDTTLRTISDRACVADVEVKLRYAHGLSNAPMDSGILMGARVYLNGRMAKLVENQHTNAGSHTATCVFRRVRFSPGTTVRFKIDIALFSPSAAGKASLEVDSASITLLPPSKSTSS